MAAPTLPGLRDVASPEQLERAIAILGETPEACLLCAAPEPRRAFRKSGKWFWSCPSCELVFVHDIYPEYVQTFDEDEYGDLLADRAPPKPKELRRFAELLADFAVARTDGRLLEVGCGEGFFLAEAERAGWETTGVEILPGMAERAREERGLDVRTADLIETAFPDASFDAVYMNEVIEHVIDPVELMLEVRRVLRPGGMAILRTGNARSWSARLRRGKWWYYWFCGHGHIRFYSPRAARALARAAGFDSVRCHTRGFALRESEELRSRWYKPPVKIAQSLVSPLAGLAGAGQRLTMSFVKAAR